MANSEHVALRPEKNFEHALYDFMCMSKGVSQSLMIRYFLEQIIVHSDLCEQAILVYSAPPDTMTKGAGTLKLYEKATNVNSIADFPGKDFSIDEGLAGLLFRPQELR